jgi:RNA polymerase sigma-70 factor, ECF subfamily
MAEDKEGKHHQTTDQIREDYEWVLRSVNDPSCFKFLYEKYYERILTFVFQRVPDKETAYDVTSQVFLKAMVSLSRFRFKGVPFSAWLFRIALNEISQYYRSSRKEMVLSIDETGIAQILKETQIDNNEDELQFLLAQLSTLQEEDSRLIEMRYFDKMAFREIGLILNITENNCKVRLYRVLDKLRARLLLWKKNK